MSARDIHKEMFLEATSIALIVGVVGLISERAFRWAMRIRRSTCCGGCCKVEMESSAEAPAGAEHASHSAERKEVEGGAEPVEEQSEGSEGDVEGSD